MPALSGNPIRIEFRPELRSCNRRLESGGSRGVEVHAAGFLRERRIVLDAALRKQPRELARILIHELFHFVWLRAGNPARRSYEALLAGEWKQRARGELGWSAEHRKPALKRRDRTTRSRAWREYACESFCDTAAWLWAGTTKHDEYTLRPRFRQERRRWFRRFVVDRTLSV
jgi:hypothetical protein